MAYTIKDVYELCKEIKLKCISTEYINIKSDLLFICSECGEVFKRNFDNLKTRKSNICNKCGKKKSNIDRMFSYEYVKEFVSKHRCELLSTLYVNVDEKLQIKCACGNVFETSFYKFDKRNKRQCNECGKKILANKNAISKEKIIEMLAKEGYTLLDREIKGRDQKIFVQCDKKHNPYWVNISKYKSVGRRCPHCNNSKGEKRIENILSKNNINFKPQYIFKDLIGSGGGYLRFDFAIFDNDKLKCLIEYDGQMHYEETGLGNDLEKQKAHDMMKNDYCIKNSINLIRIPYWDFDNIETIMYKI